MSFLTAKEGRALARKGLAYRKTGSRSRRRISRKTRVSDE
jgi:hypothetical protein